MNKKILSILLALVLFAFLCVTGFAVTENVTEIDVNKHRLIDNAHLLSISEENELLAELDKFSERDELDFTIFTTESLGAMSVEAYAERAFDLYGYGYGESLDGILLVISMENRDFDIYAHGNAENIFTAQIREYIASQFTPYLSDGEYKEAFSKFIYLSELCVSNPQYIQSQIDDYNYDYSYDYNYNYDYDYNTDIAERPNSLPIKTGLVAIVIGVVIAILIVLKMVSKLKTVHHQKDADSYVVCGSMNVTESRDMFLYHTVTRTAKPKNTSNGSHSGGGFSSSSSSGGSHTSGKF